MDGDEDTAMRDGPEDDCSRSWREFQRSAGGGPDLPVEIDEDVPELATMKLLHEAAARAVGHAVAGAEREPGANRSQIAPLVSRIVAALAAEFGYLDPAFDGDRFFVTFSHFWMAKGDQLAGAQVIRAKSDSAGVAGGEGYETEIAMLRQQDMEVPGSGEPGARRWSGDAPMSSEHGATEVEDSGSRRGRR